MKKYTTPEVEVIKFQAMETIADEGGMMDGSAGVGEKEDGENWD